MSTTEELAKVLLTLKDDQSITDHLIHAFSTHRYIYHPIGERVMVCVNPGRLEPDEQGVEGGPNLGVAQATKGSENGGMDIRGNGFEDGAKVESKSMDSPRDLDVFTERLAKFIQPLSSQSDDPSSSPSSAAAAADAVVAMGVGKGKLEAGAAAVPNTSRDGPRSKGFKLPTTSSSSSNNGECKDSLQPSTSPPTRRGHRQTIIALGESGSGKSTVMRRAIQQAMSSIAACRSSSEHENSPEDESFNGQRGRQGLLETELMSRLDRTLRIAEVLGNATTRNNADSSRMGKLIQIWKKPGSAGYDFTLRALMIEDTRLSQLRSGRTREPLSSTASDDPERAFHVFYVLAAGGHPALERFPDLLPSSHRDVDHLESKRIYHSLTDDFKAMGWSDPVRIWNGIAAVWLLVCATSFDDPKVEMASEYLEIESAFDWKADLVRYKSQRQSGDALKATDELFVWAKIVYRKIFLQLVPTATIKHEETTDILSFIDICGFEILHENQLQQLMINLCNERLFETYKTIATSLAPGNGAIDSTPVRLPPSRTTSGGANANASISPADEVLEQVLTAGTKEQLSRSLSGLMSDRSAPGLRFRLGRTDGLEIPHVDNIVRYHWAGFVEDNIDGVRPERMEACRLFQQEKNGTAMRTIGPSKPLSKNRSVVRAYQRDLREIVDTVIISDVLFLRCIKAHPDLIAWRCDTTSIRQQVKHLGLLATLEFVRDLPGTCVSTIERFSDRYMVLGTLEEIFKYGAGTRPIAAVFRQKPPLVYYSENAKHILDDMVREFEARKARLQEEEEARRKAAEEKGAIRLAAEQEVLRRDAEEQVHRETEARRLQAGAKADDLQPSKKGLVAGKPVRPDETQTDHKSDQERKYLGPSSEIAHMFHVESHAQVGATHSTKRPDSARALDTTMMTIEPRLGGHRVVSAPVPGTDPFTPMPTVTMPSKPQRTRQSHFLDSMLQSWTDSTEEITKHGIEMKLVDTILAEIERTTYSKGPKEGRTLCMSVHCFLECEFYECFRNTQSLEFRLKGQRVHEISLLVMICRVVKTLRDHYTQLSILSSIEGASQSLRAKSFEIQMSKAIEQEIETRPSVWSYMANRAGDLAQGISISLQSIQQKAR